MITLIKVPKLGLSGDTALINEWNVKKGEKVQIGDSVLTIQTDKATFEVEAEGEGVLLEQLYEEGDEVPVLSTAGIIGEEGEDYTEHLHSIEPETENQNVKTEIENKKEETNSSMVISEKEMSSHKDFLISPRAKQTAIRLNIDYKQAVATGPEGRIIERDILALLKDGVRYTSAAKTEMKANSTNIVGEGLGGRVTTEDIKNNMKHHSLENTEQMMAHQDFTVRPLSQTRKVIARNMLHSVQTTAQVTLNLSFDATSILNFRKNMKQKSNELSLSDITLNDMIMFAVSRTILNHETMNAHLEGEELKLFNNVHLGMAVDTVDGLLVPTIFHSNKMTLNEIAKYSKKVIEKCQKGTITPDEMAGASFTITNIGSLGVESFSPILNPPQVGILGINTITNAIHVIDNEIIPYPSMGLSLTFDHRAIDGAPAGRFLKELANGLENFQLLLAQ